MYYQFEIKNVSGIKSADVTVHPGKIALIAAGNAAGKSSLARAASAAAAATRMPCGRSMTQSARAYVNDDAEQGSVFMSCEDGTGRRIIWNRKTAEMEGTAESIGASAAGIARLSAMDISDRAKLLREILKAEVQEADLLAEFTSRFGAERAKELTPGMWKEIKALSMDSVLKRQQEEGRYAKRKWQDLTGKPKWGEDAGSVWVPDGYSMDLELADLDGLKSMRDDAEKAYQSALKSGAVVDAEIQQLVKQLEEEPAMAKVHAAAKEHAKTLGDKLEAARAEMNALPQPKQLDSYSCPDCECKIAIVGGAAVKYTPLTDVEITQRMKALSDAKALVADFEKLLAVQEQAGREAQFKLKGMADARKRLDTLTKEKMAAQAEGHDEKAAEAAFQAAHQRVVARGTKDEADKLHKQIVENAHIQEILDPEGLPRKKLAVALAVFSTELKVLSSMAHATDPKWEPVSIQPDLALKIGDRDYIDASGSERFRIDTTIQLMLAIYEKRPFIIVDAADILDAKGRGGLMQMLTGRAVGALVTMTVNSPDQVPNLQAMGAGCTYWIADRIAAPIGQLAGAAK